MTHDLMRDLLVALERDVVSVRITALEEGIFYAMIDLGKGRGGQCPAQ